ncbi:MAG: LCP family protein [Roseiflexaceae bacterium]|nr:LCP family protein [Roseiflexaceae bacterium]
MKRPSRRMILSMLGFVAVVIFGIGLSIGMDVKRAADNIIVMSIPPVEIPDNIVVLPEATAMNLPLGAPGVVSGPAPTAIPDLEPTILPLPDAAMTFLLMGTDARIGEDIARTDAMIVLRVDFATKRVSMLSLPRDLAMTIPRVNEQLRINTAFYLGEKRLGKGYGPALAKEAVGKLLGLKIDHFMLINFEGFEKLIDKLGGVTIDVPKAIYDPTYPRDAYAGDIRTMKVSFKTGEQKMDGETALIYARTRHADSDFGRQSRQQEMLMAIFDTILDQGLYTQVTNVDEYTDALRDYVTYDIALSEMVSLARIAPDINIRSVEQYSIKPSMLAEQPNPYYLFINDKKAFSRLVNTFVNGEATASAKAAP